MNRLKMRGIRRTVSAVRLLLCPKLLLAPIIKQYFIIHSVEFFHGWNIKFLQISCGAVRKCFSAFSPTTTFAMSIRSSSWCPLGKVGILFRLFNKPVHVGKEILEFFHSHFGLWHAFSQGFLFCGVFIGQGSVMLIGYTPQRITTASCPLPLFMPELYRNRS